MPGPRTAHAGRGFVGAPVGTAAVVGFCVLATLAFIVIFFLSPLIYMVCQSFKPARMSLRPPSEFTLGNYSLIIFDPFYREIMLRTLRISAISSAVMLVLGYPVAYLLRIVSPKARGRLLLLVISPLLVSVVVRTYGWVVILGREGLLNSTLLALGIKNEFSTSTHLFNEAAVIVGLVHVFFPFMVLALYNSLEKFNLSLLKAAANLGAPPWRIFFEVMLPLTMPGVLAGVTTVFPLAMGSFITVAVLGGPGVWVVSMSAYQEATGLMNWQLAGAIGVSLLVAVAICVMLFSFLAKSFAMEQDRR